MWAADTSWLFALFHEEDAHHRTAFQEASVSGPLLVNPSILTEFLDLVRDKVDHNAGLAAYEDLVATPTVRLVPAPKPAGMARILANQPGLSWADASAIATALDEGAGLRTFDKGQRKAFDALA